MTNTWHKELLSFITAIVLFIAICTFSLQINHFLPDSISFILFFASPLLLILNIYIAYHLTKILNNKFTSWRLIGINLLIISVLITHMWMGENFYPRGKESSTSLCGSSDQYDVYSPDKTKKAIVYLYSCGATTGYTSVVTLANAHETLEDTPLIADVFRIKGENIHLQWINNNNLHIDYNQSQKVFHSSKEFNGVRIDF
ncbi:MAG: hypothetical protein A2Y52_06620 [Sulfuricurvum sp. RIFCSPLOWO2_02_43_6]|nr:MAG: hypothetical protein A2Y52_06620 [Sulfuricurvum sp. RIFCSPLOWO2_02_43_6]